MVEKIKADVERLYTFGFDNEKKFVDIFCEIKLFFHFRNQK